MLTVFGGGGDGGGGGDVLPFGNERQCYQGAQPLLGAPQAGDE